MRPLLVLLLVAFPLLSAPVPKALKEKPASPEGKWHLLEFNGKPANGMTRDWAIEGERLHIGNSSVSFTTPDPDKPNVRVSDGMPAVIEVDGDTLRYCYTSDKTKKLTECKAGPGVNYYVFERVKEKK